MTAWAAPGEAAGSRPSLLPPLSRRSAAAVGILTALGFLGNVFHVEVFLSFYYLFGNLPGLLVALEFGPVWGALSALAAASYAVPLFGHPYAPLWLVGEVAFVGFLARRHPRQSPVVWDAIYWLALGGPLIGLAFTQAMHASADQARLVALKHVVNGLANASLASLLASTGWVGRLLTGRRERRLLSMQQATFQLLLGLIVLPALLFAMAQGRQTAAQIEGEVGRDLAAHAQFLADRFGARLADRARAGAFLDRLAREEGPAAAAPAARAVRAGARDLAEVSLVDPVGRETSLGGFPPAEEGVRGARIVIGPDGRPALLSATAPIAPRAGVVVKLDPAGLKPLLLLAFQGSQGQNATILTEDLLVAATTRPDLDVMDRYDPRAGAEARPLGPGVFVRTPARTAPLPLVEQWRRSSLVGAQPVAGAPGWTALVEQPMAPYQRQIQGELSRILGLVLGLLCMGAGLSFLFAGYLTRPLAALAAATTDLPGRLQRGEEPTWPSTWIAETDRLIGNAQGMARELRARFAQVEQEVVQRRASEEEARRRAAEVADLYDRAPCGYHSLGPDGTFLQINDTELGWLGYTRDEIVGRKTFDELLPPGSLPVFRESYERFKESGQVRDLEFELVRKDGTVLPVVLSASAVRDGAGAYVMSRSTVFDNTERRRTEQAIEALNRDLNLRAAELLIANQELEAFVYTVSHDLRAPLRHVDGYSQALLEDFGGRLEGDARHYCERLRAASQHMGRLLDGLLHLSRVTRAELRREEVDLSALARAAVERLRAGSPERAVEVSIEEGLQAEGDPRLLALVLENLLDNAWKYTARKPQAHIRFGAAEVGGERAYFVRDDGAGFDMAYAGKLFQPFQRLHAGEEFEGSGIGLATVRRVVHRHGGRVWAEGEVGRGATFSFTLSPQKSPAQRPG